MRTKVCMVSESANYNIVCDLANKTITVSMADYQDNAIKYNALWMVGSATSGGWSIDQGTQLSQDATNPLVYTATTYLSTGEFKVATNKYRDLARISSCAMRTMTLRLCLVVTIASGTSRKLVLMT